MKSLFVVAVLAMMLVSSVAVATHTEATQTESALEPYSPSEAFSYEYGDAKDLPGMLDGQGEPLIPTSIFVDSAGNILVADPAKKRVVVFDRSGGFRKSIPVDGVPMDAIQCGSDTAVLTADKRVALFNEGGVFLGGQKIAREVARNGLRRLSASRGSVWVETGNGDAFRVIEQAGRGGMRGLSEQSQSATKSRGRFSGGVRFDPYYANGGRVVRYGADCAANLEVHLRENDLATIDVVGQDASGAFYVIAEIGTKDGCRTECRKYSKDGVLLARFDVVSDVSWSARSTAVSPDGTVYRLVASKTGVRVVAYSPGGES